MSVHSHHSRFQHFSIITIFRSPTEEGVGVAMSLDNKGSMYWRSDTHLPITFLSSSATGLSEYWGSALPSGRPRWLIKIIALAPLSIACLMVGTAAVILPCTSSLFHVMQSHWNKQIKSYWQCWIKVLEEPQKPKFSTTSQSIYIFGSPAISSWNHTYLQSDGMPLIKIYTWVKAKQLAGIKVNGQWPRGYIWPIYQLRYQLRSISILTTRPEGHGQTKPDIYIYKYIYQDYCN